jgi:hypothetical protein
MIAGRHPSLLLLIPDKAVVADMLPLYQFGEMIDVIDVLFTPFGIDVLQY